MLRQSERFRCQIQFQNFIVQTQHIHNRFADFRIRRKYQNPFLQLFRRSLSFMPSSFAEQIMRLGEHAARSLAFLISIPPGNASRPQAPPAPSGPYPHFWLRTHDLEIFLLTRIHDTYIQLVCIRMLLLALNVAYDHFVNALIPFLDHIDFNTSRSNAARQIL